MQNLVCLPKQQITACWNIGVITLQTNQWYWAMWLIFSKKRLFLINFFCFSLGRCLCSLWLWSLHVHLCNELKVYYTKHLVSSFDLLFIEWKLHKIAKQKQSLLSYSSSTSPPRYSSHPTWHYRNTLARPTILEHFVTRKMMRYWLCSTRTGLLDWGKTNMAAKLEHFNNFLWEKFAALSSSFSTVICGRRPTASIHSL